MNVLVSAIACHPVHGSEGGVGWRAATAIAGRHHVHVLTSTWDREAVQQALATGKYPNLSFTFFGTDAPYHENRLLARLQSWIRYLSWTRESLQVARQLQGKHGFDIVHHVTYSSWRVASPLWRLDLPLVWGPVGGVAEFPFGLMGKLSISAAAFELLRNAMNRAALRSKALRKCLHNAAAVVCSNQETFLALQRIRGDSDGMFTLSPSFFSAAQIAFFRYDAARKHPGEPLRCFAGGSMVGSKGLVFAIEAIRSLVLKGLPCHFLIAGCGPEIPFLQRQVRKMKLEKNVQFESRLTGESYRQALKDSHVFLLPSFRENAPGTILEAMLAGCVPVVVDASAQGDIVDSKFGFKVPIRAASQITADIADALVQLARNHEQRILMGQLASEYVALNYQESSYITGIEGIYEEVLGSK